MIIILDSNIFRNDILLRNQEIDILLDYIKKTNSLIILPQIIKEEIVGIYKRILKERIDKYNNSSNSLNNTLIRNEKTIKSVEFSVEEESGKYLNYITKKLKINESHIIPYKQEYLPELVNRAIYRKKPLGSEGQSFRDGIIWLTILDFAKSSKDKEVVFISNNPADFSNDKKDDLHPDLISESTKLKLDISLFHSLKDFIKKHSEKIEFINEEWILSNIDLIDVSDKAITKLNSSINQSRILRWCERRQSSDKSFTGYFNVSGSSDLDINDFNVYEMSDGDIIIGLTLLGNFEIEIEYEFEQEDEDDYDYDFSTDSIIKLPNQRKKVDYEYEYVYPDIYLSMTIIVRDKKILSYEIDDFDIN